MNERIQKLAEQATSLYQTMDGEWEEDFDKEKFAELIVRQCISMVLPYNEDEPNAEKLYELADAIGEHFGVEE